MFASVGSILYGYDLGVIAEAIASQNFKDVFHPTDAESGAVVSVFTGGAFFGAAFAGPVGDLLGRRKTILLGALIFLVGGGLQTGAQSLAFFYSGRCKEFGNTLLCHPFADEERHRRLGGWIPCHDHSSVSPRFLCGRNLN